GDDAILIKKGRQRKIRTRKATIKGFINKQVKYVKNKQLYKLIKLDELLLRNSIQLDIQKQYHPDYIITDGAPLINILAWGSVYRPELFTNRGIKDVVRYLTGKPIPMKKKLFYLKNAPEIAIICQLRIALSKPKCVFFLKVSSKTAMHRIDKGRTKKQSHENEQFLRKLQEAYALVLECLNIKNTYSINANKLSINGIVEKMRTKI
ncbi:MAG: hypothetical protein ABIH34_05050, partial [Nanoarchaeota archaeon]